MNQRIIGNEKNCRLVPIKFPVAELGGGLVFENFRQFFADINGSVLAPGAANGDSNITSVFLAEFRQPFFNHIAYVGYHLYDNVMALKEVDDGLILAGKVSKFFIPVWIG